MGDQSKMPSATAFDPEQKKSQTLRASKPCYQHREDLVKAAIGDCCKDSHKTSINNETGCITADRAALCKTKTWQWLTPVAKEEPQVLNAREHHDSDLIGRRT